MSENVLEIRHLSKSFGSHKVLEDINFTVRPGDVTSIIGSSGSGRAGKDNIIPGEGRHGLSEL